MRKLGLLLVLLGLCLAGAARLDAQAWNVSVRVFTDPPGPAFWVDGKSFHDAAVLLWPEGSKHILDVEPVQGKDSADTIYAGVCWSTNIRPGECLTGPITADRDLTWVRLTIGVSHKVTVAFYNCPDGEQCTDSPGRVVSSCGGVFVKTGFAFCPHGSTVSLTAYPNPGFVFTGWSRIGGVTHSNAFQWDIPLNFPIIVRPLFQRARPVRVLLDTVPAGIGLKIFADRAPVVPNPAAEPGDAPPCLADPPSPADVPPNRPTRDCSPVLEWQYGTVHSLGAPPSQRDAFGRLWVFDSWSDGGAINHDVVVPAGPSTLTYTARFLPGSTVTFLTDPPLLKLKVDGRENWQNYTFEWAAGTTHQVSAPAEQFDAQGRKYRFAGWSNGQPATHEVTIEGDTRLTAAYTPVGQINLTSSLPGVRMKVDGEECVTPCALEREVGAVVRVAAPDVQAAGEGSRMVFRGWSDAADLERSFTVTRDPHNLRAEYQMQHRFGMVVEPAEGALCNVEPRAADGYYDAGAELTVHLDPYPGYRITGWEGDWTGSRTFGVVRMSAPKSVRARLEAVPYLPDAAVRNAAGETPQESVAPGSIVSIFGKNLAPWMEAGPESPLAQALAGVTVRLAGRLLPLVMVSPEEIRAQLPSDAVEGPQELTVRWEGKPESKSSFTVARNAPGLFYKDVEGRPYGVFVRADGQAVSADSPARRGETITLLGTGLGPFKRLPPDGFLLPDTADFLLADPVELICGESVLEPLYAGSSSSGVGLHAVRFRVGEELPSGDLAVKVRVNGAESNVVLLPVE